MAKLMTTAPGRDVILYDGYCRLCLLAARRLKQLLGRRSAVELRSFREEGALTAFPDMTLERCERRIQLVQSDGRIFEGAEALIRVLARRPLGWLLFIYYVPGLRQVVDLLYDSIARYRFHILGRQCPGSACRVR